MSGIGLIREKSLELGSVRVIPYLPESKMKINEEKRYLFWLNKHSKQLQRYSGQWVGVKLGKGVVASGRVLKKVRHDFLKLYPSEIPHLIQVPPKGEKFYILILL